MEKVSQSTQDKKFLIGIGILSVLIPIVVAFLLFIPQTGKLGNLDVSFLPHLNGILNTATTVCLIIGYFFIRSKNEKAHKVMMMVAFVLSSVFLVSYVVYHYQAAPTKFGGEGIIRPIYYFLLITHITLAAIIVPLVLLAFYYALSRQIPKHKSIVKYTFPIWLYVAVSGVLVYLLISPYYQA
ncbi:MAG: DUF420 domain-containing protein [Cytophagales bacterium]|nr:DUF420 domain-containing protein [Cytophagales bacterium]MDW8383280.1 DUF420 domain-containing protein [Flammeovirgaceae bacterium]